MKEIVKNHSYYLCFWEKNKIIPKISKREFKEKNRNHFYKGKKQFLHNQPDLFLLLSKPPNFCWSVIHVCPSIILMALIGLFLSRMNPQDINSFEELCTTMYNTTDTVKQQEAAKRVQGITSSPDFINKAQYFTTCRCPWWIFVSRLIIENSKNTYTLYITISSITSLLTTFWNNYTLEQKKEMSMFFLFRPIRREFYIKVRGGVWGASSLLRVVLSIQIHRSCYKITLVCRWHGP